MSDRAESLEARVERLSVAPGGMPSEAPRDVVLVPPRGDLTVGFSLCRELLNTGSTVRLVGHGVTLEAAWPPFMRDARGLVLTELGAYVANSRVSEARELLADLVQWIERSMPSFEVARASEIFMDAAITRIGGVLLSEGQVAVLNGLLALHGGDRVHCVDPDWIGAAAFGPPPPQRRAEWRLLFLGAMAAGVAETALRAISDFVSSRPSRKRLRELRARSVEPPRVWLALIPRWHRINAHLLRALQLPDAPRIGLILLSSLDPGVAVESDLRRSRRGPMWGGLGPLASVPADVPVEQLVGPETPGALAGSLFTFAAESVRSAARIVRNPAELVVRGRRLVSPDPVSVAKLATIDLWRAVAAHGAGRRLRTRWEGARVVFSASAAPDLAMAQRVLERAGAQTVDFFHGWQIETFPIAASSRASVRIVWANTDRYESHERQRCAIGAVHFASTSHHVTRGEPRRVLLVSNYLHRDTLVKGKAPNLAFLHEFLRAGRGLRGIDPNLSLRWRPHPADAPQLVAAFAETYPDLELSRGRDLERDFAEADVVVSTVSTVAVEALSAGLPVFVQVLPEHDRLRAFWPASRVFFRAEELRATYQRWRAEPSLDPERAARTALFGDAGTPRSIWQAVEDGQ